MNKQRIIIFLFLAMIIFSFNSAEAQITIVGQNNPAVDIQTVQKAVDQGGDVTLKGTFNFGNEGRVNITKDVKIVGETDNSGNPVTKITGGLWTFHSPLPSKLPPEFPGPKITIQAIHFDGALWAPVLLAYSSGATIAHNKITNIKPQMSDEPLFGKPGLYRQQGIVCSPRFAQPIETRKYIPNLFTGNLIIENNNIDLINDAPTKTMAQGVFVVWTTGISAQVNGNTIINSSRNSVEAIENYRGKDGSGTVFINDNKIVTSVEGLPVPSPVTPNGMVVGWFLDLSGSVDPQRNIKYILTNNAIRTRGKTSAGIAAFSDGIVIVNNTLISEGTEAVGLGVRSSHGYIAFNRIEGASNRPAIGVGPLKPCKGSKNVFVENDLRQFKSSTVDVMFEKDASDNLFIGQKCKVGNLGTNNLIQMMK